MIQLVSGSVCLILDYIKNWHGLVRVSDLFTSTMKRKIDESPDDSGEKILKFDSIKSLIGEN